MHADQAWSRSTGKGVVVAVIDSGVDGRHPDLAGQVLAGKDFVHGAKNGWSDLDGHGTAAAGIIAARRGNGRGIVGVAPSARILPVKVGDSETSTSVAEAIVWAADHGAKVINASLGLLPGAVVADVAVPALVAADQAAVDHAWARGAVVVASAGNNSEPLCSEPALLEHVLCVGSVDKRQVHSAYSNEDLAMRSTYLVAPGGSDVPVAQTGLDELLWTTVSGDSAAYGPYNEVRGTSFAAPFVSGVAALLSARGLTNAQIVQRLLSTCQDLGLPGRDGVYGYGEVDAARAVR